MAQTLRLRVTDFRHGPANARWFGAKFDGATKTWTLTGKDADLFLAKLSNPNTRARCAGLEVVTTDSGPCPYYTTDQGCPLHGEACADGRD